MTTKTKWVPIALVLTLATPLAAAFYAATPPEWSGPSNADPGETVTLRLEGQAGIDGTSRDNDYWLTAGRMHGTGTMSDPVCHDATWKVGTETGTLPGRITAVDQDRLWCAWDIPEGFGASFTFALSFDLTVGSEGYEKWGSSYSAPEAKLGPTHTVSISSCSDALLRCRADFTT